MNGDSDGRLCSNCRAELPPDAEVCPSCGVFAGQVFDGKTDVQRDAMYRSIVRITVLVMILAAVGAAAFFLRDSPYLKRLFTHDQPPPAPAQPTRVVSDRPGGERRARGAVLTESEAVRVLRRHLTSTGQTPIRNECLAILSNGSTGGSYIFTVVNSCDRTRLGKWRVNGKSEEVSPAR